jgi:predicted RNase H-like nuclease (RuvC/YqgF family)
MNFISRMIFKCKIIVLRNQINNYNKTVKWYKRKINELDDQIFELQKKLK